MKFFVHLCALITLGLVGCKQEPTRPLNGVKVAPSDAWKMAVEAFRFAEGTRAGDEWTRYRGGLELLSSHFAKPEVQERVRQQSAERRNFLQSEVHLTANELAEVESPTFRTADAHYLDECFLLRDAARALEVQDTNPLKQAEMHFGWVMRNVILHDQADEWVPPAFTLRRGVGNALERALVFLALLRQSQIEGCLIVAPQAEPRQFLVAVLDPTSSKLYLFDTRLGLPLWTSDRKSLLSLQEALSNPELLLPSLISPQQASQLEAWLVCPLYALPPRILELEQGLSKNDSIVLHLNPIELSREIAKAAKLPTMIWNPPMKAKDKTPLNSPTRALRMFLPEPEGGVDKEGRVRLLSDARLPLHNVLFNFAQIGLSAQLLPPSSFQFLKALTHDLFNKYDLQTREMFLRGQHESVIRRHERLEHFAKDELGHLVDDRNFRDELIQWQRKLIDVNADEQSNDPQLRARGTAGHQSLWNQDQFVRWMIQLDKEEKLDRDVKKTVVTRVLAVGMRDYFDLEMSHSRARSNHEMAVHEQALLQAQDMPRAADKERARQAWMSAKSSWANSYADRILLDFTIKRRLKQLSTRGAAENGEAQVCMLESLHLDVQKYFQARLRIAECVEHLEGTKAASAYLTNVKAEIEALEKRMKDENLNEEIKRIDASLNPQVPLGKYLKWRLQFLARDWSERGNYYWMKRQIDVRIGGVVN